MVDTEEIRYLTSAMKRCAKCLDGDQNEDCHYRNLCDDYAMNNMVRCIELTEMYQHQMTKRALQTIRSRMNGFRVQNELKKEYKCKVSKALASAAHELLYTIEIFSGRGSL